MAISSAPGSGTATKARRRSARRGVATPLLSVLLALAATAALAAPGASVPHSTPPIKPTAIVQPTPAADQNVISFLGQVMNWSRELTAEVSLIEEPAEMLYLTDNRALANQAVRIAFEYARAQAALLEHSGQPAGVPLRVPAAPGASGPESLRQLRSQTEARIKSDQADIARFRFALRRANRANHNQLASQLVATTADLEWQQARAGYITTMQDFERGSAEQGMGQAGLEGQIAQLQRSLPPPEAGNLRSFTPRPEPTGLLALAQHLLHTERKYQLLGERMDTTADLANRVEKLHAPLRERLRALDRQAELLARTTPGNDAASVEQRRADFEHLIEQRKLIAAAALPLSEESVVLKRYGSNLKQWRAVVLAHSTSVLHALLARVAMIALLMAFIFTIAVIWRRLTFGYVEDVDRRRQLLKVRDATVIFLMVLVLLFTFTTELAALATMLGFAAAGVAVALQDVFLSIAGYFRLGGRYGMRHGDLVEVMGVRGEVLEIGLTKLTLIELNADGGPAGPTGRLVVIPNSSVFRDKFLNHPPGSNIVWSECRFTVSPDCDYRVIEKRLLEVVEDVFARYRDSAYRQLRAMEKALNARLHTQRPQSRLRLRSEGLEIALRYPVEAPYEAQVADEIARRLLDAFAREPQVRFVPAAVPNIQPADAPQASVVDTVLAPAAKAED